MLVATTGLYLGKENLDVTALPTNKLDAVTLKGLYSGAFEQCFPSPSQKLLIGPSSSVNNVPLSYNNYIFNTSLYSRHLYTDAEKNSIE